MVPSPDAPAGQRRGAARIGRGSGRGLAGGACRAQVRGIDWREDGILLSVRRHGETAALIDAFTEGHGRHGGIVPGGAGRRMRPVLQPGAVLDLSWRARRADSLGTFRVEPRAAPWRGMMADGDALAALNAVVALLSFALPERAPYPRLHAATAALIPALGAERNWPLGYLAWERLLLAETGFGLDLSACAVTGRREGLAYVSPRTGRAVTAEGAGALAPRLLPLPACLADEEPARPGDLAAGLRVTGHFLANHLAPALGERPLPAARARLVARLAGHG